MSSVDILLDRLTLYGDRDALIYQSEIFSYRDLLALKSDVDIFLDKHQLPIGAVVVVRADYSPISMAIMISLIAKKMIVVPIATKKDKELNQFLAIACPDFILSVNDDHSLTVAPHKCSEETNSLIVTFRERKSAGLVLFTSGSTGVPKAVLHDLDQLLSKFVKADKPFITLCFLMFDHIGGVDTYFYTLFSGGSCILPSSRDPQDIFSLIEDCRVEVLPVSPTFLNLSFISGAINKSNMSTVKIITFGSEKASEHTLERLSTDYPEIKLVQKYGVTELGSPSSKTHDLDPSLIKMDSEDNQFKVEDGLLLVKTKTAMVGYLNAPSPFNDEGWFNTGDSAEVFDGYIRILGRVSEIINVGGEKVFPAEVEELVYKVPGVVEVSAYGEKNPLIGEMVCLKIRPVDGIDEAELSLSIKTICSENLEKYKVPVKIVYSNEKQHNERFKNLGRSKISSS